MIVQRHLGYGFWHQYQPGSQTSVWVHPSTQLPYKITGWFHKEGCKIETPTAKCTCEK